MKDLICQWGKDFIEFWLENCVQIENAIPTPSQAASGNPRAMATKVTTKKAVRYGIFNLEFGVLEIVIGVYNQQDSQLMATGLQAKSRTLMRHGDQPEF